jgi:hypothetical protein
VKSAESCEYPQLEVGKIPVAECHAYDCSQGFVGAFYEPVAAGSSPDKMVEDLLSPNSKRLESFFACTFSL